MMVNVRIGWVHRQKARRLATAIGVLAALLSLNSSSARRVRPSHVHIHQPARHLPYPRLDLPPEIEGAQYFPVQWGDIVGWAEDDHLAAFKTFRASCKPILARKEATLQSDVVESKALGNSLREPCRAAQSSSVFDEARARAFFERHFLALRISRLGEEEGFVTGYYEPVIDGSRVRTEVYNVPVYRRPSNLFVRGYSQDAASLPNKGEVFRKIGRRKLVPYYDRAQIEDGAIAGRGLELCWLKNHTDLLFTQIQGSARVRLEDGSIMRINYDAHNGYPYTPVGRLLIDRGIIPREQMSMQRIREWMEQNPDGANELRRQNRSYIFFHEVHLADKDEPLGAQGVSLTPGRSIAVDKNLHVYGTPFFIQGELPIETETSKTPFRRLMVAQDTGSAIVGPARADLYLGAGPDAGRIAGRIKNAARFVMLVPRSLDPLARGSKVPVPDPRPSEAIAKITPPSVTATDKTEPQKGPAASEPQKVNDAVPLPAARPSLEGDRASRPVRSRHRDP